MKNNVRPDPMLTCSDLEKVKEEIKKFISP